MSIRFKFFLFFLPPTILSFFLLAFFLSYQSNKEKTHALEEHLKTVTLSIRSVLSPEDLDNIPVLQEKLSSLKTKLFLSELSIKKSPSQQEPLTFSLPLYEKENCSYWITAKASSEMEKNFKKNFALFLLILAPSFLLITFCLFLVIHKIIRPMQKLGHFALSIAGGQYGENIQIHGPKEILSLASTLNTMSECLQETLLQLKENIANQEKPHEEKERAVFLQNSIFQKALEKCPSTFLSFKNISFFSSSPKILFLDFSIPPNENSFQIDFWEAKKENFEGFCQLLSNQNLLKESLNKKTFQDFPFIQLSLEKEFLNMTLLSFQLPKPLIWSLKEKKLSTLAPGQKIFSGDFFFLYTTGMLELFQQEKKLEEIFSKILKFFAEDGVETCADMLQKELSFIRKKSDFYGDVHLLCFQILDKNLTS